MFKTIARFASLVKFSHTIFAMPFALVAFVYAYRANDLPFEWSLLVKVLLCMVFARNAAMGFNRYVDRLIDARNPRTAAREIPSGGITPRSALIFVGINGCLFVATAAWINLLAFVLSPVALSVSFGYSLTKRVSWSCHLVLGTALAIAPIGAYIAVTGTIAVLPILLAAVVVSWVAGFDIIYALQDVDFDRNNALHSIPVRFGVHRALMLSAFLHLLSLYAVFVVGSQLGWSFFVRLGAVLFAGILLYQHLQATPKNLTKINAVFGLINGISSLLYCTCLILALLFAFS